ncbi:hypothetical protein D0Z00_001835 [Geotrichum galactomycetum]|uniref:Uncharacterized protein n=1 Tax=Geotrichum galactomycetum TaxID=27317 RepID=A0ACB6V5X8_9ASCO|nr:hypothetical protein D0Z00_001835 [Geotrichum candidum]
MNLLYSIINSIQQLRRTVAQHTLPASGSYQSLKSSLSAAAANPKQITPVTLRKFAILIVSGVLAVFFLFYILLSIGVTTPIHITTWILDSTTHATTKEGLLASINYNETVKEAIKTGTLYQLTSVEAAEPWRQPFLFNDPHSTNKAPLRTNSRCTVYTYFPFNAETVQKELANDKHKLNEALKEIDLEQKILETWARAMWAIGFQPVILNATDATLHPQYEAFKSSNVLSPELKKQNIKWLAWLAAGAGIYSDYRVLPVATNSNDEAIQFLKAGNFKERLAFDDHSLSLIVSNIKDTKPFLFDIMRGFSEKELLINFEVYNQDAFAYYSNRNYRTVTNTLKGGAKSAMVPENDDYVDAKKILSLMQAHSRQRFHESYPDGFRVTEREGENRLAHLIMWATSLKDHHDYNLCRPTPSAVRNLAYVNGRHRTTFRQACAPRVGSAGRAQNPTNFDHYGALPPPLGGPHVFTLASIEHPYTFLALRNDEVTVDIIRETTRDAKIRELTNAVVGSAAVGTDLRLLAFKDAVYQHTSVSNISWVYMEQNAQDAITAVEWDIGFRFYGSRFENAEAEINQLKENYVGFTSPENYQNIINRIQNDLDIDYLDRTQSNQTWTEDPVFDALKLWHVADYEAWRFIHRWAGVKKASRQAVIDQLEYYKVKMN